MLVLAVSAANVVCAQGAPCAAGYGLNSSSPTGCTACEYGEFSLGVEPCNPCTMMMPTACAHNTEATACAVNMDAHCKACPTGWMAYGGDARCFQKHNAWISVIVGFAILVFTGTMYLLRADNFHRQFPRYNRVKPVEIPQGGTAADAREMFPDSLWQQIHYVLGQDEREVFTVPSKSHLEFHEHRGPHPVPTMRKAPEGTIDMYEKIAEMVRIEDERLAKIAEEAAKLAAEKKALQHDELAELAHEVEEKLEHMGESILGALHIGGHGKKKPAPEPEPVAAPADPETSDANPKRE